MVFDTIVREALGEVQCYPTLIRFNQVQLKLCQEKRKNVILVHAAPELFQYRACCQ